MSNNRVEARVSLINQKMKFSGVAGENEPITLDYIPPLGDGEGYMPLEMFLMSLASCSGASAALLLRKMGKAVEGMEVKAKGIRREQHPTSFQTITLALYLNSSNAENADFEKAIKLSEETYCPVWAMIKNSVEINVEFELKS